MPLIPYAIYDPATGHVFGSGCCHPDDLAALTPGGGRAIIAISTPLSPRKRWRIVDGAPAEVQPEVPSLSARRSSLLARLAARRWEVEVGGVAFRGSRLETDDRSKLLISDAARRAEADPGFVARWKAEGGWVLLAAADIIAARDAVFAHVASCFAREAELSDAVAVADAEQVPALSATVELFWPPG